MVTISCYTHISTVAYVSPNICQCFSRHCTYGISNSYFYIIQVPFLIFSKSPDFLEAILIQGCCIFSPKTSRTWMYKESGFHLVENKVYLCCVYYIKSIFITILQQLYLHLKQHHYFTKPLYFLDLYCNIYIAFRK